MRVVAASQQVNLESTTHSVAQVCYCTFEGHKTVRCYDVQRKLNDRAMANEL